MKVIKQGNHDVKSWWVGVQFECPKCNQIFELEERDGYSLVKVGRDFIRVGCSQCHSRLQVLLDNPNKVIIL